MRNRQHCWNAILVVIGVLFPLITFAGMLSIQPNSDIIGQVMLINAHNGESLRSIARHYDIGWNRMKGANRHLNPYGLKDGSEVVIPSRFILPKVRGGIVVNFAELRLYYFPANNPNIVYTFPVSVGREKWRTPTLETHIVRKKEDPTWHVPQSIREASKLKTGKALPATIAPGPNNPLGHYAMYLGKPGYLIHGNNAPNSIGTYASSGCIRLFNKDIEQLFSLTPINTPVHIIHHAHKAGWRANTLYLAVHPSMALEEESNHLNQHSLTRALNKTNHANAAINWHRVTQIAREHKGIPIAVAKR